MDDEQLRLLPGQDPDALVAEAKARWNPVHTYCMFSGGNDSMAAAHRCREHYDTLFFIDTGTGVDEGKGFSVIEFVREAAAWLDKPLVVLDSKDAYEHMVLGGRILSRGDRAGLPEEGQGFPGPGMHGKAYTRLKERQVEELLRRTKEGQPRTASVLFISGIRKDESATRATRHPLTEKGSAKFVNPLTDWTRHDLIRYRRENRLPESPVAAMLHRSGECNCGAFAKAATERPMLESLAPRTFARIRDLEQRAEAAGLRWCRWGGYDIHGERSTDVSDEEPGLMCSDCPTQLSLEDAA
jgi:3'-phosphoadenosine 5'-phosphosulfate sulfotransferase (PAPS reductase)/FAD synthetase